MKVRTATFRGKPWAIDLDSTYDGFCDAPEHHDKKRILYVDERLTGKRRLTVLIHEALHAENPELPEDVVERSGESLGRFLWRLGYRAKE